MTFSIYYAHTAPIQILTINKLIVYRTVYIVHCSLCNYVLNWKSYYVELAYQALAVQISK